MKQFIQNMESYPTLQNGHVLEKNDDGVCLKDKNGHIDVDASTVGADGQIRVKVGHENNRVEGIDQKGTKVANRACCTVTIKLEALPPSLASHFRLIVATLAPANLILTSPKDAYHTRVIFPNLVGDRLRLA